jgi:hypothetical protein
MVNAAEKQTQALTPRGQGLSAWLSSQEISDVNTHQEESAGLKWARPRGGDSFQMSKQLNFHWLEENILTTKLKKQY